MAPAGGGDRPRRHRAGLGDRVRGARSLRRCGASLARAAAHRAGRRCEPRPDGRPRVHGSPAGRHRGLVRVRAGLARAPGAPRCGNPDRRDPDRLGRHGDVRRRPAMGGARPARPGARAEPQRDGRPAGRRTARDRRRAPGSRGVGPPRRPVRRRGRPRPHRQGRPGPPGRPALAHRARRPQCAAPPRRERTGEHDLRLPSRRAHVPGRHAGAPRANRGPVVPDDGGRGLDPARCRCGRGRGASRRSCWRRRRTARSRRSSSMRSGTSWRRSPRR